MQTTVSAMRGREARVALVIYVVMLMAVPSELIVSPLGAAGTPAGIIGVGFLAWWLASLAATAASDRRANPVKWLLAAFAAALLTAYLAGMSRPITAAVEVSSADRSMLALCGWLGVSLVVIDGLTTPERLDGLLKIVAGGAVFIASLGALQFFFGLDIAHLIRIPGLTANSAFGEIQARSDFRRVSGTTSHPIEFGVMLSSVLPLAIHHARFADGRSKQIRWWLGVLVIAGALPLSVARSGILGGAVALSIMFFTWPRSFRRQALAALLAGMVVMSVVVPGLLGTIRGLFLNASSDPSTQGRTQDYGPVFDYVVEAPIFGRGVGTFIPSLYRTLDNHYLGVLIEAGIVGLVATLALFVGGIAVSTIVRRNMSRDVDRDLAQSLTAALAVLAVNAATFDLFGFSMCAGLVFLLIGCIGAMYAIHLPPSTVLVERLSAKAIGIVAAAALSVTAGGAAMALLSAPLYYSYGTVIFEPPDAAGRPVLSSAGRTGVTASLIHDIVETPENRERLAAQGATAFDVALGDGSLMMGSDRIGSTGPVVHLVTRSPDADESDRARASVINEMRNPADPASRRRRRPRSGARAHSDVVNRWPIRRVRSTHSRPAGHSDPDLAFHLLVCACTSPQEGASQPPGEAPRA